ncbi:hypothetical protein ACN2MM_03305 [Alkalilimnicola ehrlichii MLHE-1]|uniref:Uncharacterized protein n=1 Tax=Alkalilimnicola ehrlichii (strain ATCC BAA-1101 / DSM 17681 / MLHE-1) TaxID=187272 RepID=Q0AB92_ALKEH|nr:hypothetical protein [Alkalilimnicola ehrlichii]ABI55895.1 conserved hypothetical protein [Alkalilimnicola ehrlichii MLHE-1]
MQRDSSRYIIRASVKEFSLPPIHDGLVLGRESPIGHMAVAKALDLLTITPYEHLEIEDEVIGDVLVRSAVLRKLSADQVRDFVLTRVKPLMGPEEIVHLEMEIEVQIDSEGT